MYLQPLRPDPLPLRALAAEPDELFASVASREAQARLAHLVELRGIGLITGEVGSGKTTVCRQLAASLHPGLHRLFYVPLSTGNVMDMYKAIAWQLGLPVERNRASAYRSIHTEVCRLSVECRIHPVLVVDEAQHLRNDVLEDLRLLTNYAMDSEPRLCLLLVGPERVAPTPGHGRARIPDPAHRRAIPPRRTRTRRTARVPRSPPAPGRHQPAAVRARRPAGAVPSHPRPAAQVNLIAHYALSAAALAQSRLITAEHVQCSRRGGPVKRVFVLMPMMLPRISDRRPCSCSTSSSCS